MRDERGVVVAVRGAYRGAELAQQSVTRLGELGRIASVHPDFAVQVVVHDAEPADRGVASNLDARRGEAAVRALVAGGANLSRIHAELAGAKIPVADPNDTRQRERNERLEIVFVGP